MPRGHCHCQYHCHCSHPQASSSSNTPQHQQQSAATATATTTAAATPLPRSGPTVSHPTFGHEATVESGAWAEDDDYDDEEGEFDDCEYEAASDDDYNFGECE
jgi:hypothetical protein